MSNIHVSAHSHPNNIFKFVPLHPIYQRICSTMDGRKIEFYAARLYDLCLCLHMREKERNRKERENESGRVGIKRGIELRSRD